MFNCAVIAILGRPNVGKSTLFNRLTQTNQSITSAYPGTTRDRQYGEVNQYDRKFIVIDTGGIIEKSNELSSQLRKQTRQASGDQNLSTLINQQALHAIEDASKLLLVVDAKEGITAEDKILAKTLRRTGKPMVLAVNKVENKHSEDTMNDAYELGIQQTIPISAKLGTGLSHLVQSLCDTTSETDEMKGVGIKIAIVGQPNAGKSTLVNRMLGEERVIVHEQPGTTRDSIFIHLERFDQQYTLIDTAGVRKRKKVSELPEKFSVAKTLQAIEEADVVLYVIDARKGVSDQDMKLLGFVLEVGKALVIGMNKWDGMTASEREQTKTSIDRHLEFVSFARLHFISALHGTGVGNLFDSIHEAYECAHKKLTTPKLTKLLQLATTVHTPPLVHGRRIKLRYAHSGGHDPIRIIIHGNQLSALPESYRRFLAKFFQDNLKLHGVPIFIEFKTNKNPYKHTR